MNTCRVWKNIAWNVAIVGAFAFLAPLSHAQTTGPPTGSPYGSGPLSQPGFTDEVPAGGGVGLDYLQASNGVPITIIDGVPRMRPLSPSASDFTTSVEVESWKNEGSRIRGNRDTVLLGYTHGLKNDSEVGILVPIQYLKTEGVGSATGLNDTQTVYRKYLYNPQDPDGMTTVLEAKVFLPTGNQKKGLGIGQFSGGPSVMVSKPFGKSLGYVGAEYTFVGKPSSISVTLSNPGGPATVTTFHPTSHNTYVVWLGAVTQLQPQWQLQYELTHFEDVNSEQYTRVLVGPRYQLTPTTGLQLDFKQELHAAGKAFTVALGYSSRF